jgi:hypothetical protein
MTNISYDEAIFFLESINSYKISNRQPMCKRKTYYTFLKNRESKEYKKFIEIYKRIKYILSERECRT